MLMVGDYSSLRSERRLCEEVKLHLLPLDLDDVTCHDKVTWRYISVELDKQQWVPT